MLFMYMFYDIAFRNTPIEAQQKNIMLRATKKRYREKTLQWKKMRFLKDRFEKI